MAICRADVTPPARIARMIGTARFGGRHRHLCSSTDHLALMLGDGGEDVDRQLVRHRQVAGEEVDATFEQA